MSLRTYEPSLKTKNKILKKAVELFNESGTATISMNALAEATGISAGNLQYHYKSKDDLIRAIFELMYSEWGQIYTGMNESIDLPKLRDLLRKNFDLTWKYRFFYREYAALLHNDTQLSQRFRAVQDQRVSEQAALIKRLAMQSHTGTVIDPKEIRNVVLIGWVLGNTWLSYVESTGQKITKDTREEAVDMLLLHYRPYLFKNDNSN